MQITQSFSALYTDLEQERRHRKNDQESRIAELADRLAKVEGLVQAETMRRIEVEKELRHVMEEQFSSLKER